jgi:DNA-binding beta-propeller fold protein YncE
MKPSQWFLMVGASASFVFAAAAASTAPRYEVWAADQNANVLYVLDPEGKVLRTIDGATLGEAKRPHMLWGVGGDEYVYTANSVSNSVSVLSNRDGQVKAVISGVGKLPHSAQPHPKDPTRIYVMNIGPQAAGADGKPDRGETITEIVRTAGPKWEIKRFLDLKAEPVLADTTRYPSRRPVCAGFSMDGRYMMATLFNGGIAVVDLEEWKVVKGWDKNQIAQYGCGFASVPGERVSVTGPTGSELYVTAGDDKSSWLYVFDIAREPQLLATHDLSKAGQDAHGVAIDRARKALWIVHRVSSNVTIHPLATIRRPNHRFDTIAFVGKTPDLVTISPDSRRAYITLRGPKPAPTIPHAAVGETPGVAIVDVRNRKLLNVVKLGDQELADFHGVFIPAAQK